jgi:hypothetical protein
MHDGSLAQENVTITQRAIVNKRMCYHSQRYYKAAAEITKHTVPCDQMHLN